VNDTHWKAQGMMPCYLPTWSEEKRYRMRIYNAQGFMEEETTTGSYATVERNRKALPAGYRMEVES
jgi:hypothetical protein